MAQGDKIDTLHAICTRLELLMVGDGKEPGMCEDLRSTRATTEALEASQMKIHKVVFGNGAEGLQETARKHGRWFSVQAKVIWILIAWVLGLMAYLVRAAWAAG